MGDHDPLAAFFAAGEPAERDVRFRAAVMERIARRRLRLELLARLAAGLLAIIGLALLSPALERLAGALGGSLPGPILTVTAIVALALIVRHWMRHPPRMPAVRLPRLP